MIEIFRKILSKDILLAVYRAKSSIKDIGNFFVQICS